jgi:hypothetical protein
MHMHFKLLAAAALAGVFLLAPARVEAACCDQSAPAGHHGQAGCCEQPCCQDTKRVEPSAIELLLGMDLEMDPQLAPAPPVKQTADVWFQRPVMVGKTILQGHYLIEHDNDRMARGEPCTHVYAFNDRLTPVATFHCTHLERDRASQNTVVLAPASDSNMQRLTEFQFAGESFAHGYPQVR